MTTTTALTTLMLTMLTQLLMMTMTTMVLPVAVVLDVVMAEQQVGSSSSYTWDFDSCDVTAYYSGLPGGNASPQAWSRSDLQTLLKETHRNVLPFTRVGEPGNDDVWSAMIDLDRGTISNTVQLLYTNTQIDAIPFGQRTWLKEHLWPVSRGIGLDDDGPDLSDVHNIRPVSTLSDIVRGDSYFGECGVLVRDVTTCQQPAEGSADDTCICDRGSGSAIYTPPTSRKGEVARALLYMDLRYDGSEDGTSDLRLTDCPFQSETDMAYLSQMITWHLEDPPSPEEITRNNQACQRWQGNRNPFVDYPDLAVQLHYEPYMLPPVGERVIYEECEAIPTQAPTAKPNDCDTLTDPGDIYIWLLNSQDPDSVGLYTFQDIPPGYTLYMTDNPWNGTHFVEQSTSGNDGTLMVRTNIILYSAVIRITYHTHHTGRR